MDDVNLEFRQEWELCTIGESVSIARMAQQALQAIKSPRRNPQRSERAPHQVFNRQDGSTYANGNGPARYYDSRKFEAATKISNHSKNHQILRKNSDKGMTRPELYQTLVLLLTGGTEPTASGMSGIVYNILSHPKVLQRLTKEISSEFSQGQEILNAKTSALPYLNAVISESLRIYPPVPARFPRRTGKQGNEIDGYSVPKDVSP